MANQNKLKAYVRYDGTGRVIAGGPILQRFKPKVGNWVEIDAKECCNDITTTTTSSTSSSTTTTTTTATPTTTTTTTTQEVFSQTGIFSNTSMFACLGAGGEVIVYYTGTVGNGTALFTDAGLTIPYNSGVDYLYLRLYFEAAYQVCTMSENIISSYAPC